jgi:hypothetical protein
MERRPGEVVRQPASGRATHHIALGAAMRGLHRPRALRPKDAVATAEIRPAPPAEESGRLGWDDHPHALARSDQP